MSNLRIQDGKVLCPQCGNQTVVHAFAAAYVGKLRVQDGQIVSYGHKPHEQADEPYVYCYTCKWQGDAVDIEIT